MKRTVAVFFALGLLVVWAADRLLLRRHEAPHADPAPESAHFGPYRAGMALREAFESLPPGQARTALTLLEDNTHAWVARWRLLESVRESLDVSYFILREDLFGAAFLGALLEKAQQGARIRLLFDAQGTAMSFTSPRGNDWLDTLANHPNIELKLFRPLFNRYLEALLTVNPFALVASEHDKIMVADRRIGMIGGRNISAEYFADPRDLPDAFEDVDLVLEGRGASRHLIEAFETQYGRDAARPMRERVNVASYAEELHLAYRAMNAWLRGEALDAQTAQRLRELDLTWQRDLADYPRLRGAAARPAVAPDARAETRLLDSPTRLEPTRDAIGEAFERLTRSAREEILIVSPYLVLTECAVRRLAEAGARGVSITVVTNGPLSSDNDLSQAFFLEQWPELLARVPRLRIFVVGNARTLHSKLAVFDRRLTLVGTYNLDPVSMHVNSEIMAAVWSRTFARDAARSVRTRLATGAPAVYAYRIERDAHGRAVRDADGKPVVVLGPRDHSRPEEWRRIRVYRAMLRAAEKFAGFTPFF